MKAIKAAALSRQNTVGRTIDSKVLRITFSGSITTMDFIQEFPDLTYGSAASL